MRTNDYPNEEYMLPRWGQARRASREADTEREREQPMRVQ
jgi:hypothetical protein